MLLFFQTKLFIVQTLKALILSSILLRSDNSLKPLKDTYIVSIKRKANSDQQFLEIIRFRQKDLTTLYCRIIQMAEIIILKF